MFNEKQITKISKVLDDAKGLKPQQFTPIIKQAIVHAVSKESSLELKQKAWMLVYHALYPYIVKNVGHYAIKGNFEDYMNDFFIVIMENLGRWRPEQGKLTTFFGPLLEKSCNVTQFKEQTFTSMYYRDAYIDIARVVNELAIKGITEPTEKEIHAALKKKGLKHSIKTVRETLYQNIRIVSLDSPNEDDNCLLDILTTEKKKNKVAENARKAIDSLEDTYRIIIDAECDFYAENASRKKIKIDELKERVMPKLGDVSTAWLRHKRGCAERQFFHNYNKLKTKAS